jgi:D-alanine transaminase
MPEYPSKVFLNGEILDSGQARISVFDRGFLFGDGIYEVMARIKNRFLYKEAHLNRLRWCVEQVGIEADVDELERAIPGLLESSGLSGVDSLLYIQVTRGVAPRQHSYPRGIPPTIMMYAWAKTLPDINMAHASVITRKDFRWWRCDLKTTSLLGNVMANELAVQNVCYETVFERNGLITEASHSNIFFVKGGVVHTHPNGPLILDGVTRQAVLELCDELQIPVRLQGIPSAELEEMDEAFLTGTSTQLLAIKKADSHSYFEHQPGPITRRLQEAFFALKYRN